MTSERIVGVFEGGGAKGIAYVGALQAIEARGVSFAAVAGASAGAITAALIAAGFTAEEIRERTSAALGCIVIPPGAKGRLRIAGRLRNPTAPGIADTEALRTFLNDAIREKLGSAIGTGEVTFKQLYEATGIELFVVAVDTLLRRHIVFHHHESPKPGVALTPDASVVGAVVASSSIPLVFGPSRAIRDLTGVGEIANAVVDGGVWTNFPTFVFVDEAFRSHHELGDNPFPVVGFQLDETRQLDDAGPVKQITAHIPEGATSSEELLRRGRVDVATRKQRPKPRGVAQKLRRFDEDNQDPIGRAELEDLDRISSYPLAKGQFARILQGYIEQALEVLHSGIVSAVLAIACVASPVFMLIILWNWVFTLSGAARGFGFFGFAIAVIAALGLVTVSLAAVSFNALFLYPLRRIGYPILATYGAASGVPYWLLSDAPGPVCVVRLPILPGITTLSFAPEPALVDRQIVEAREITERRLPEILGALPQG